MINSLWLKWQMNPAGSWNVLSRTGGQRNRWMATEPRRISIIPAQAGITEGAQKLKNIEVKTNEKNNCIAGSGSIADISTR